MPNCHSDNQTVARFGCVWDRALGSKMRAVPVDLRYLQEITGGDRLFFRELMDDFVEMGVELFRRMAECVSTGDFEELRTTAHALKGGSFSVGSEALGNMAAEIESCCLGDNKDSVVTLIDKSRTEFDRICKWWAHGSEDYAA